MILCFDSLRRVNSTVARESDEVVTKQDLSNRVAADLFAFGKSMNIVIAESPDAAALTRVEIESKRASIPHLVDPIKVDFTRRHQRWTTYFRGESPAGSTAQRRVLKAVLDGALVGFIAGHLTSRHDMESEIQSFYILREHQRKGIGSTLLSSLAAWLVSQGVTSLCVGIAPENSYRAFYLKHGARYLNAHWMYWSHLPPLASQNAEQGAAAVALRCTKRLNDEL